MPPRAAAWLPLLLAGLATLAGLAACARSGPRLPLPIGVDEFRIPWRNAFPSDLVVTDDGAVWFTDRVAHVIGRFDPETQEFTSIPTPTPSSAPYGLIRAPDGSLWYAASKAGRLGRVDVERRTIEEHELEGATGGPHLLACNDGVIWFSLRESGAYGRYDTRTKETRLFNAREGDRPYSVQVAPDGRVWFSIMERPFLYEVDPETDSVTVHDFTEPPEPGMPWGSYVVVDSLTHRAQTVAIMDSTEVSKLTPQQRATVRSSRRPWRSRRITVDETGNVWITDYSRDRLVRFDPRTGETRAYDAARRNMDPYGIQFSPSGHIWFYAMGLNTMLALEPESGETAFVRLPTPNSVVRNLAVDVARRRVWLPMSDAGRLGMIKLAS